MQAYNGPVLPKFTPLNPIKQPQPFNHSDYLFELKHDGFRALAYFEDGRFELVSRRTVLSHSGD